MLSGVLYSISWYNIVDVICNRKQSELILKYNTFVYC